MKKIIIEDALEINNVFDAEDIKSDYVTQFSFREKVRSLMVKFQMPHAYLTMHSTELDENPFSPNLPLHSLNKKVASHIFLVNFEESFFLSPVIQKFDAGFRKVSVPSYVKGTYLILLVFAKTQDEIVSEGPATASHIINSIRITNGIKAAGPQLYRVFFNGATNECYIESDPVTIFYAGDGVKSDVSSFVNSNIAYIDKFLLNKDADALLDRALSEIKPDKRFLFLWLCFDATIPSKYRRELFEFSLSSEVNNKEVLRLFNLRCDLAHEGKSNINAHDCTSIIWALRIAICPDKDVQKTLSRKYEDWIIDKGWALPESSKLRRIEASFDRDHDIFTRLNALKKYHGENNENIISMAITELWKKLPTDAL